MNERTAQILEAAIQGFIDTGEPVSSGWLYDQYDFGIKPAMIRLELDALEHAGYLAQPYHSAGRVPTDRGYEFFAELAMASAAERFRNETLKQLFERRAWADLMGEFSVELSLLGIAADLARDAIYKNGLEELVSRLDAEDRGAIRSVIRDFEQVDSRLPEVGLGKLFNDNNDNNHDHGVDRDIAVFVGKKSPITKSECLSVVRGNYGVGGTVISIFAIGPKNMDYKKVITVFKNL